MNKRKSKMRRKIPILRINLEPGASYSQLKNHPVVKTLVIESLLEAIEEGVKTKKQQVALFEIAGSGYQVMLDKQEWKPSLEIAMEYFIEKEDYDACISCRDLIKTLK